MRACATASLASCGTDGGERGPRLVARLFGFEGGDAPLDDAGGGGDFEVPLVAEDGADGDGEIEVARGAHPADRAAVDAARPRLELADDLHGPDLRGAGQR